LHVSPDYIREEFELGRLSPDSDLLFFRQPGVIKSQFKVPLFEGQAASPAREERLPGFNF
jgi:hypothetical protein